MDFLSNLIKRPLSLVVSESPNAAVMSSSSPPPTLSSQSGAVGNENANGGNNLTDSAPQTRSAASETPPLRDINTLMMESLQMLHDKRGDGEVVAPSGTDLPLQRSGEVASTCLDATSSVIEELLIQINDSLDQAALDEERDVAAPIEASPLSGNKSFGATAKMSPGVQVAPSSPAQQAVGGAELPLPITPKMVGLGEGVHPHNNNNNNSIDITAGSPAMGASKPANKFIGLTEFDESKIPDLPGGLNSDLDDQMKLTFEENLIPTLTASVNTSMSGSLRKINALIEKETDTAFSSDNETFAECQPYPEAENFASSTEMHSLERTMELSEADAYRSAMNSYNGNVTCDAVDPLNATLENPLGTASAEAECSGLQGDLGAANMTFEEEPMDVDVSMSLPPAEPVIEPIEESAQMRNSLGIRPDEEVSGAMDPVEIETVSCAGGDGSGQRPMSVQLASHEFSLNKSVELPSNSATVAAPILTAECVLIQDNSVDSATDVLPASDDYDEQINATYNGDEGAEAEEQQSCSQSQLPAQGAAPQICVADEPGNGDISTTEEAAAPTKAANETMTASSTSFDPKLSLTLDMTSSFTSARSSAPNSPGFPTKLAGDDVRHFPRSPRAAAREKAMPFLEKSEYAEQLNATRKKSMDCMRPSVGAVLHAEQPESPRESDKPKEVAADEENHRKRETFGVATEGRRETFSIVEDADERQRRGTFGVVTDGERRETFAVVKEDEENGQQHEAAALNVTVEAMDCDDDFGEAAPPECAPHSTSPPIPTHQRRSHVGEPQLEEYPRGETPLKEYPRGEPQLEEYPREEPQLEEHPQGESPLEEYPPRATSPPIPTMQTRCNAEAPPPEEYAPRSSSPPIPTLQKHDTAPHPEEQPLSPPIPTMLKRKPAEMEEEAAFVPPPPVAMLKRPSIHRRSTEKAQSPGESAPLSAKEKTKSNEMDEKEEVFVDQFSANATTPIEDMFALPEATSTTNFSDFAKPMQTPPLRSATADGDDEVTDDDFQSGSNLILNPSDFDYLLTKGSSDVQVNRSSLLMRFDPLLGLPVPGNQQQLQHEQNALYHLQVNTKHENLFGPQAALGCLSPTIEEDEHNDSTANRSLAGAVTPKTNSRGPAGASTGARAKVGTYSRNIEKDLNQTAAYTKNATMSVDVINEMKIENDCNKTFENSNNTQLDEKQSNYNMDELEKKIKNEVLKTEDIEKKLKEAEQREEALIKRITEKDKTISKMNGVIESYEKTIAELVREKEQLIQNYEKQMAEVRSDRDSNYHHLTSLETTFSDLHVKYEKSKEMTSQLKSSEEALLAEKRQNLENLRLQEQRYEKMKNHAMQQLEMANKKLESLTKEHAIESTKLKALLKKEEISRASINEQLMQKTRENAELVKICDELINGQGS